MNFGKILATAAVLFSISMVVGLSSTGNAADEGTTQAKNSRTSSKKSVKKPASKKASRPAGLASQAKKNSPKVVHSPNSKLGTDFDFQGLAVGGKYNSADGILTTVEGDKSLDNLLNPRPNFKDRLAEAAESQ